MRHTHTQLIFMPTHIHTHTHLLLLSLHLFFTPSNSLLFLLYFTLLKKDKKSKAQAPLNQSASSVNEFTDGPLPIFIIRSLLSYTGVCCPSGVRLYSMSNNTLRVYWRSSGSLSNYTVDVYGIAGNYTCSPQPGGSYCDISDVVCGDVYTVVVAPFNMDGSQVSFCPHRLYSGMQLTKCLQN